MRGDIYMRIIFNILTAPFVAILTISVLAIQFFFQLSGWVFVLASSILVIGGVAMLFTGMTYNGIGCLILGFLVSPYGLPMLAVRLTAGMHRVNLKLRNFIAS